MKHEKMIAAAARLRTKLDSTSVRDADLVNAMINEIENLRENIQSMGEHADICTYYTLGEVCNGCRCKRKNQK